MKMMRRNDHLETRRRTAPRWIALLLVTFAVPLASEAGATASDSRTWKPHEHPATLVREVTGFTEPSRTVAIAAEFAGRVVEVRAEAGDRLGEPDRDGAAPIVVLLDDRFATIARDRAQASLSQARVAREEVDKRLAIAQREEAYQKNEVERIRDLAERGKVRASDLDAAVFQADRAALRVAAEETAAASAEARVETARLDVEGAEERLKRHRIRGRAGWVVLERDVEPGAMVGPATPLLRLADVDTLAVTIRLSEPEIGALRSLGDDVELRFRHHDEAAVRARVHRIGVDHDPITNKRLVELRFEGAQAPSPTGGLEVRLQLEVDDPSGSLVIPREFLRERFEQTFVFLDDGRRLPVLPLRADAAVVLVSPNDLPVDAVLVTPPDSGLRVPEEGERP